MSNELLRTVPRMKYIILPMLMLFHTILIAQDVEQMIKARPVRRVRLAHRWQTNPKGAK